VSGRDGGPAPARTAGGGSGDAGRGTTGGPVRPEPARDPAPDPGPSRPVGGAADEGTGAGTMGR